MKRFVAPYKKYLFGAVFLNYFLPSSTYFPSLSSYRYSRFCSRWTPLSTSSSRGTLRTSHQRPDNEQPLLLCHHDDRQVRRFCHPPDTWSLPRRHDSPQTSCYFGSSAIMVPLRTGIVRDIRIMVYDKMMHLPLGFFSQERKGDIIARMSGDVGEVENSITSSLDMLIKNRYSYCSISRP